MRGAVAAVAVAAATGAAAAAETGEGGRGTGGAGVGAVGTVADDRVRETGEGEATAVARRGALEVPLEPRQLLPLPGLNDSSMASGGSREPSPTILRCSPRHSTKPGRSGGSMWGICQSGSPTWT